MREELRIKLGLSAKGFHKNLAKAKRGVTSLNRSLGLLGMGVSVGALAALAKSGLTLADNLGTAAAKLGVTTDFLQELNYAAEQAGVEAKTATMAYQRFARRLAQAAQGGGELLPTLQELGIAVKNNDGSMRSAEAVLHDFADGLNATEGAEQRLLHAFKAFDSEGVAMLAVLQDGSDAFKQLRQEAHDAGVVLEEEHIRRLDQADKSLKKWGQQGKIAFARFTSGAIKAFKIGQKFFEYLFDQGFRRLPILKEMLSKLLRLDFDGFQQARGKLKGVTKSLGEIYDDAAKTVGEQLKIEEQLADESERRRAAVAETTKQLEAQRQAQQKLVDAEKKLATAKRDRSKLTLDELGGGTKTANDKVANALRAQISNANNGLTPDGKAAYENARFERNQILAERVKLYEELGNALRLQGNFGRSQRAFNKADQIREQLPFLKDAERHPFKVMEEQLAKAKEQVEKLGSIDDKMTKNFPLRMIA